MFYLIGFISTIFLANWFIGNVGDCSTLPCTIPVGFGLLAPSGVLAVGLGFTLRDLVQRQLGVGWTVGGILAGSILSALLSPSLALASGAAFLLSEFLDLSVYTPLQNSKWLGQWAFLVAVIASNGLGAWVDSYIFLSLAGFGLAFLPGQVLGKLWMTLLVIPLVWWLRHKHQPVKSTLITS